MKQISKFGQFWRGMAMGMAEVIPGVSGGTIAFITGIYERLLAAIGTISPKLIKSWKSDGFKAVWEQIDGNFLLLLFIGMVSGVVVGAFGITYLIENHAEAVWAFFFGLIIASVIYVIRSIESFDNKAWFAFGGGAILAYAITAMYPMTGSDNLFFVFCSGMIAICALILPGVSGSFMLLIMGMYTLILGTLKSFLSDPNLSDLIFIIVFILGCLLGLLSFSRIVSRLFKNYPSITLATLAGFMLGSIHKIWPWRNPELLFDKSKDVFVKAKDHFTDFSLIAKDENFKTVLDVNVLPDSYYTEPNLILVIISASIGLAAVFLLSKSEKEDA